jgi:hypothetical protein
MLMEGPYLGSKDVNEFLTIVQKLPLIQMKSNQPLTAIYDFDEKKLQLQCSN